jgi:hypothetical protein
VLGENLAQMSIWCEIEEENERENKDVCGFGGGLQAVDLKESEGF